MSKNRKTRKIFALTTVIVMLFTLFAQVITVFADEGNNSYDRITNNVTEIENIDMKRSFESAAEHNISMQYLTTYNILRDTYLGSGVGTYGNIYSTDVSSESYSGTVGNSINGKVVTGAQNLPLDFGDQEANIDVNTGANSEQSLEKQQRLSREMADMAADVYIDAVNKYFGIDGNDLASDNSYLHDSDSDLPVPSSLHRDSDSRVRNVKSSLNNAMKKSLSDYFYSKISGATSSYAVTTAVNMDYDAFTSNILNPSKTDYNYFKNAGYSGQYVKKNFNSYYENGRYGRNNYRAYHQVIKDLGISETSSEARDHILTAGAYVDHELVRGTSQGSREAFINSFNRYISGTVYHDFIHSDDYQAKRAEWLELTEDDRTREIDTSGYAILSWTPIVPTYSLSIPGKTEFVSEFADAGINVKEEGDNLVPYDMYENIRAVQLGDLVFKDSDPSPVLVGPASSDESRNEIRMSVGGSDATNALSNTGDGRAIADFLGVLPDGSGFINWLTGNRNYSAVTDSDIDDNHVASGTFRAITGSRAYSNLGGNQTVVGIDNYGNIIAGETGQVIIPYWQNSMYINNVHGKSGYISHPVYLSDAVTDSGNNLDELLESLLGGESRSTSKEASVTLSDIQESGLITSSSAESDINVVLNSLSINLNPDNLRGIMLGNGSASSLDKDTVLQVLAVLITAGTYEDVARWNRSYLSIADDVGEMYVGLTAGGYISGQNATDEAIARWTAASLIQKIGLIFDWGFAEIIRITLADMLVDFYNSSFAATGLSNIFYTPNVTESSAWSGMIEPLGLLLLAFTPIYILFMVFKANRGTATAKDIIKQFIMLALIFLIPIVGYGAFTNALLNRPAEWVLGNQLKQTIVLDFYVDKRQERSTFNESYARLFGNANMDNKIRTSDNYIVTFYTMTDRRGFEIDSDVQDFGLFDEMRYEAHTRGFEWNKNRLVSVNVSLYDLYDWATTQNIIREQRAAGVPSDEIRGYEADLFRWLNHVHPTAYSGINNYKEYSVNTNTVFDASITAGGALQSTTRGEHITGSELFRRLHEMGRDTESSDTISATSRGLMSITELMKLFTLSNETGRDGTYYTPTPDDLHAVMRDLSMTGESREIAFGSSDRFSKFTSNVVVNSVGAHRRNDAVYNLARPIDIPIPENDIFGIYGTVRDLNPYVASGNASWTDMASIEKMTYEINYDVLTQLSNVYAMIPNSTRISPSDTDMGSALRMAVVSEIFFRINGELGFRNFPTGYLPETVSTDNYLKMIFIPFADYQVSQSNFASSEVMTNNVAEYIAVREHSAVLLLFILSTLAMILYGLFMMAIFYGFLLVVTLYAFIKNYIIKNDYNNKSWLGVLGIYTVLGLVKFGFVLSWYAMTTILNFSYTQYSGATYPFVLIHSLVIIAYLYLTGKMVIVPTMSAVYKDRENLGGEHFSNNLSKMRDKMSAKASVSSGRSRPMGDVAGGSRKRFKNMARGTGKFARGAGKAGKFGALSLAATGALGYLAGRKLTKPLADSKAAKSIGAKVESAKAAYNNTRFGQMTSSAADTVGRGTRSVGRGARRFGRGMSDLSYTIRHPFQSLQNNLDNKQSMNYRNNVNETLVRNNVNTLSTVPKAVNGVAANAVSPTDGVGKVYNATNGAKAAVLTLGSVAAATALVTTLQKEGRVAKAEGNKVFVDATGEDLSTPEGRAALLDGGVNSIQETSDNYTYKVHDTVLSGKQGTPLLYGKTNNGSYTLLFSDRNGLDTRFYGNMLINKEFSNNFTIDPDTVERSADGRIKPNSQVKVIPKNRDMTEQQAQAIFKKLYREDTEFRKENKISKRKGGDYRFLDLSGIQLEERKAFTKDAPAGVMVHDGGIYYKENNKTQEKFVNQLKSRIQENTHERKSEMTRERDNLISYIKDGQGHGIVSELVDSKEDPTITRMFGDKVANSSIAFNTGNKKSTESIKSFVQSVQNVGNVSDEDRKAFEVSQAVLHDKGTRAMMSKGSHNAVNKAINFLSNKHTVNNTSALKSIVKTKEQIDTDLAKGLIVQEQADKQYQQLYNNTLLLAKDSNYLNDMLREEASKVDPVATDKFNTAKEVIEKKYNIHPNDVDKIDWDDESISYYKSAFGKIKGLKVQDNIGRLNADGNLDEEKLSFLVDRASGVTFKDKDYSTGYKSRDTKKDDDIEPKETDNPKDDVRKQVLDLDE